MRLTKINHLTIVETLRSKPQAYSVYQIADFFQDQSCETNFANAFNFVSSKNALEFEKQSIHACCSC